MSGPLHPLVVHFPIAFCVLLPMVAICAFLAMRRGTSARCAWGAVLALQVLMTAGAFVAKRTGGGDRKQVIAEVAAAEEPALHHTRVADRFVIGSYVALALGLFGLLASKLGQGARVLHFVVALVLLWLVYDAGASGGELVYEHGAADAFRDR